MDLIWLVLKFIIANVLLIIVSSTLIGFIIRGMLQPKIPNPYRGHKEEWYIISQKRGLMFSIGATSVTILLFILLFNHSNIYIIIGIIFNMLSRIKDLLNEIRTGIKTTKRTMTNGPLDIVLSIITMLGIGIFNYGLYIMWIK
jgi:hypothetical protein